MLDLLDLCLIAHFGFGTSIPWWLWVLGVLNTLGVSIRVSEERDLRKLMTRYFRRHAA